MGEHDRGLSRRELLRRAGLLGGGALLTAGTWVAWLNQPDRAWATPAEDILGGSGSSPAVAPFQVAFRIPSVLAPTRVDSDADYYEITMQAAQMSILPGLRTTIWGFNGEFPGPTIRARSGRRVVIRHRNELTDATPSVHLHGGHVDAGSDGYPTDVIAAGTTRDYVYPNHQIASTLTYHDHQMGTVGRNVYMGLLGAYLVDDEVDAGLNLPSGSYDVPVIIQDRVFRNDGSFDYSPSMMGAEGDVLLVNGVPQPYFEVANRKYRLRFINGSNARSYELELGSPQPLVQLALSSAQPLVQIGTDGGLLPRPVKRARIPLGPFERVEVVVDFSAFEVGTKLVLRNGLGSGRTADVMRFDVVRREPDPSMLPAVLRPLERLEPAAAAATRDFSLGMDGMTWVINGKAFDPNRIDAAPRLGTTEIWRFRNETGMPHPVHLHLNMFQVLDQDGTPVSPDDTGWKDTVMVPGNASIRVVTRFTDYAGRYVFHCHNLEHEDNAMMAQMQVV